MNAAQTKWLKLCKCEDGADDPDKTGVCMICRLPTDLAPGEKKATPLFRTTLQPGRPTCFRWSFMVAGKLQICRYKKRSPPWFDWSWSPKFMAWITLGTVELRLHF